MMSEGAAALPGEDPRFKIANASARCREGSHSAMT
jgi:hypothetical protein